MNSPFPPFMDGITHTHTMLFASFHPALMPYKSIASCVLCVCDARPLCHAGSVREPKNVWSLILNVNKSNHYDRIL